MRRKARVDTNQAEIVEAARMIGAQVTSLHKHGEGVPDLLISFRGRWYLVEVKMENGKLTDAEEKFIEKHHNAEVNIVRNVGQMLDVLGTWW